MEHSLGMVILKLNIIVGF